MPQVLDIEQSILLLEIEPPFRKKDVQAARRKMAKRWHPDIAPAGKQLEHERHLKAINEAADQLESLAEQSRGGKVSVNAVRASGAAAREARAEAGKKAYEAEQRARAHEEDRRQNDPFGTRVPDHSVVHRYARCLSYPEWGVGSVTGVYFTGNGDGFQQWARVSFSQGIRTVPAGSLQFVDFSKADPAGDRVQRFMTAAKNALAEGDFKLAAQRLVYARDADPSNTAVLRLLTMAFWQCGNLPAAGRAVRDWARNDNRHPAPHRFAARIYEDMGALGLATEAAQRETERIPNDATAWERLGRLQIRQFDREKARQSLLNAQAIQPSVTGLLDLALVAHLSDNSEEEVLACERATLLDANSHEAWSRYAHALARLERFKECLAACDQALELQDDREIRALRSNISNLQNPVAFKSHSQV